MTIMMKVIKRLLKTALGSEKDFTFEERLVFSFAFYAAITCFLSIFINIQLNLGKSNIILILISTLILFCIFILGRYYKKANAARLLLTIFALLFCNLYWLMNYGSRGSSTFLFLIHFFIVIFIWDNFQIRTIAFLVFLNICGLFAIEWAVPNLIPFYPTELARIIPKLSDIKMCGDDQSHLFNLYRLIDKHI